MRDRIRRIRMDAGETFGGEKLAEASEKLPLVDHAGAGLYVSARGWESADGGASARPGEIVPVEIEQAGDYDLVGGIAGSDGPPEVAAAPYPAAPARPRPRFPILSH